MCCLNMFFVVINGDWVILSFGSFCVIYSWSMKGNSFGSLMKWEVSQDVSLVVNKGVYEIIIWINYAIVCVGEPQTNLFEYLNFSCL